MRASDHGRSSRTAITAFRLIATLALACTVTTCTPASAEGAAFAELASALEAVPGIAPRLSIGNALRPCVERAPSGGTILRADCPARRQARAERLASIARRAHGGDDDPRAARTLAIIDLFADDERGRALDRSITALRRLATLADHPAPLLADLAAALIVRAERTQAPRDLLEAYETAEQALRHDPRNPVALYNRALALERFGLVDETAKDWRAYLAVDARSRWADDARRRLDALEHLPGPPAPPAADAPLAAYTAYAAADPQGARELGMDRLLGEWGAAVEAGDTARAADRLSRAAALGDALVRRPGGDASLADMVRAIRSASGNAATTRELARAHREYAAGRSAFEKLDFARAHTHLIAATSSTGTSPVLRDWARVHLGITQVQSGAGPEGQQTLAETASADPARYPALTARARWSLARTVGHDDRYESALDQARQSALLFVRAGERENEGAALNLLAGTRFVLGEADSAYTDLHRALDKLRPIRASLRLNNLLVSSADEIAKDGLNRSANRVLGEAVGVAARLGMPVIAAEARFRRARHLAVLGDLPAAETEYRAGVVIAQSITDQNARRWISADMRETQATISLRANPAGAIEALDSAAAYFTRNRLLFRALPALVASTDASLAAGDADGALERLEYVMGLLEQRRERIRVEPRRAAVFDAARALVDRIVLLTLAKGSAGDALRYVDRARASLATAGGSGVDDGGTPGLPGEAAVEYVRVADTLLVWTVARGDVQVFRTVIDTLRLTRTVQDLESNLQRRAPEAEVRPALTELYDLLVRPLEPRLGGGVPLVVIADGEIAAVPFAALYDARRGRYLIEERPLRFSVSLREARRRRSGEVNPGVLLVADPAFDAREHPLLERLEHARGEVGAIARGYPRATVLQGGDATAAALVSGLGQSGVVHFAGHAVFDDQRPERSYLVMAPPRGDAGAGRITATELSRLDLRNVRLVVLSACRTVRSGRSRTGGFTGLSGALLAAGAGGTVGSTWDVDDRSTAALMAHFHRAYAGHRDGPRALRDAQLALLHSTDGALRAPAVWAGFRYVGR